jgi:hypothetical protein
MKKILPIILLLLFPLTVIAEDLVRLKGLKEGESVNLTVTKKSDGTLVLVKNKVTVIDVTGGTEPVPTDPVDPNIPDLDTELSKFVTELASAVDHPEKDAVNSELSLVYKAIADEAKKGNMSGQEVANVLKKTLETYLQVARKTNKWDSVILEVNKKFTELDISNNDELVDALMQVSSGFADASNAALDIGIIPIILKLILAISSGQGLIEAILELVSYISAG